MKTLNNYISVAIETLNHIAFVKGELTQQKEELNDYIKEAKIALKQAKTTHSKLLIKTMEDRLLEQTTKKAEINKKRIYLTTKQKEIRSYRNWYQLINKKLSFSRKDVKDALGDKARIFDTSIYFYDNKGSRWILRRLDNEQDHEFIIRAIKKLEEING